MTPVEPTDLVAGEWQLRPWPAAHADLDDVLRERYGVASREERDRRLLGWSHGDVLGFAVREIATGRSVGEVLVLVGDDGRARLDASTRTGERDATPAAEAAARWASGALGLELHEAPAGTGGVGGRWLLDGVHVVHAGDLDPRTPQTPGMHREAAITASRSGATALWAGTVVIHPGAATGAHHHGPVESVIYVVSGLARMRWGDRLEFVTEAGPGDFIHVPPYVPHQEINADADEPLSCVLVRSGQEPVVVNLPGLDAVAEPTPAPWADALHGRTVSR
jgi:uncharacterized RmlC-like cupin family protein